MLLLFASIALCFNCTDAQPNQMLCTSDTECELDVSTTFQCYVFPSVICNGSRSFEKTFPCRYCYQQRESDIECEPLTKCNPKLDFFTTTCHSTVPCLGNSIFQKTTTCSKTSKSQRTAVFLSLFLGIFGADRFYLGYYVSASFKLITLGGLGIVYVIDLVLVIIGYLGPSDGSLFVERI